MVCISPPNALNARNQRDVLGNWLLAVIASIVAVGVLTMIPCYKIGLVSFCFVISGDILQSIVMCGCKSLESGFFLTNNEVVLLFEFCACIV